MKVNKYLNEIIENKTYLLATVGIIFLFILLILFIFLNFLTYQLPDGYKWFENDKYKIAYPQNWQIDDTELGTYVYHERFFNASEYLSIEQTSNIIPSISDENCEKIFDELLALNFEDNNNLKKDITKNGLNGNDRCLIKLNYVLTEREISTEYNYFIDPNDSSNAFVLIVNERDTNEVNDDLLKMVDSFKIK